jgi:hypothetical protein
LALGAVVLIGSAVIGCGSEQGYRGFNFKNHTHVTVSVLEVLPNGTESVVLTALDPGNTSSALGFPGLTSTGESCRGIVLVARDRQQTEIARLSRRICRDDEWIIGEPSPTGFVPDSSWVMSSRGSAGAQ